MISRAFTFALSFGLFVFGAGGAFAQSSPAPTFPRAADETGLSDEQLLGKRIFEDTNLSEPKGVACQSCHDPKHAFQGNNGSPVAAVARGSKPESLGTRKGPTIMYKSFSPAFGFYKDVDDGQETLEAKGGQFWDGRASSLAEQVSGPLTNPIEMNNPSLDAVVAKVKDAAYADLFKTVYGPDVFADSNKAGQNLANAVVAFETTERFAPFASKFDDFLRGKAKLDWLETAGYNLFMNPQKGNWAACHAGKPDSKDPTDWLFTDFTYDAIAAPRNAAIPANADPSSFDLGLCKRPGIEAILPKEIQLASLCGAFKVPTLRNVAVVGPYFHNGSIKTLRDAVAFYATRDTDAKHWYPTLHTGEVEKFDDLPSGYKSSVNTKEVPYDRLPGQTPRLSPREIDAIVAFLKTLTDKGME